jgi:ATP-dependent protease ClpP protease subunit
MERGKLTWVEIFDILNQYAVHLPTATIYISGEIDGSISTALRVRVNMIKDFFASEKKVLKEINININSPGGDASSIAAVLDWYDELKSEGIIVNVHAEGTCMSAATFFLGGATGIRSASKRTRFLVHEMQIEGMGGTHTQTKSFQAELTRMEKECCENYANFSLRNKEYTKKEFNDWVKKWNDLSLKETYFGANEALKWGLIDKIV